MNILFIVSDTLRRDYLGCYGSPRGLTPNIDSLASRSIVFDRYYAGSFPTVPARADLHLGKWTFTFMGWDPLPPGEVPLAAVLAGAGYQTVGVVDTPFFVHDGFNYDRGFDHFYDLDTQHIGSSRATRSPLVPRFRRSEHDYAAPRTFILAEQSLERIYRRPFFLYVDTWDPHEPWDPPDWYVPELRPDRQVRRVDPTYGNWREAGVTEDDLEMARLCYAGEIRMVDRWVGRLLERLRSLGVLDETAIVLTSDHGFYFGEHDLFGKMIRSNTKRSATGEEQAWGPDDRVWRRSPLYEEVAHVPLIVHVPGLSPRRVPALASAVDVMPTIMELAGAPPRDDLHGHSLVPLLRGETEEERAFVVTSMPLTNPGSPVRVVDDVLRRVVEFQPATITTREWALLYAAEGQPVELYRLDVDPAQATDLAGQHADVVARLHEMYVRLLERVRTSDELVTPRRRL